MNKKQMNIVKLLLLLLVCAVCGVLVSCGGDDAFGDDTTTAADSGSDTGAVIADGTTGAGTTAEIASNTPDSETTTTEAGDSDSETHDITTAEETDETTAEPDGELRVSVNAVYPVPLEIIADKDSDGKVSAIRIESITSETDFTFGLKLNVEYQDSPADFAGASDEWYVLTVTADGVNIKAQTERGAAYAVTTLRQLLTDGDKLPCVTVKDAPTVASRGVIEGFYGVAWTHEFRLRLLGFMGEYKMNTYIYAPKDDAKHRHLWRSLYTKVELKRMGELVDTAKENNVSFVYAISPGNDINLGSGYEKDFEKLCQKCEQLYTLGVREFALLLDDIPTLDVAGHAKLLNDFQNKFIKTHEGTADLICITTEYTDPMLTKYTDEIAPLLDPSLRLMWSGRGVIPSSITVADLTKINKIYGRKVYIWWNYPVNDGMPNNLFMGACEGFDKDLNTAITGLVANPMNQGVASLVPLFTTADYLWNPAAYDKDVSLRAAAEAVVPGCEDALLDFIDLTCTSAMNGCVTTVKLGKLLDSFKKDGYSEELVNEIITQFRNMKTYAAQLRNCPDTELAAEINEWLDKYEIFAGIGEVYFEMELEYAGDKNADIMLGLLSEYRRLEAAINGNVRIVSPDVLVNFFAGNTQRINMMFGFAEEIKCQPAKAITNCRAYKDYVIDKICDGDDATYFWSDGAMWQSAPGTTGYIGLDLGETVHIYNIYISTGESGGDVFRYGAVEYSVDGKVWSEITSGTFDAQVYLKELDFDARYVRMRNTTTTEGAWVKCKVFEVNTNRVIHDTTTKAAVTTSLTTYGGYNIANATDGNSESFFWSAREVVKGDYVQLDLGAVSDISLITIKTGVGGHTGDYMHEAELSYSLDGVKWVSLGKQTKPEICLELDGICAKYVRLTATAGQINWFTMSEFSAVSDTGVSERLTLDTLFVPKVTMLSLTDMNIMTEFAPEPSAAAGHSLTVDTNGLKTLKIYASDYKGVTVALKDAGGNIIKTQEMGAITELDCNGVGTVVLTFGTETIKINEIIMN